MSLSCNDVVLNSKIRNLHVQHSAALSSQVSAPFSRLSPNPAGRNASFENFFCRHSVLATFRRSIIKECDFVTFGTLEMQELLVETQELWWGRKHCWCERRLGKGARQSIMIVKRCESSVGGNATSLLGTKFLKRCAFSLGVKSEICSPHRSNQFYSRLQWASTTRR